MKPPRRLFRRRPSAESSPPIPPGADRLEQARKAIVPWQTYRLALPDGSVQEFSGADMIRDADNMLALVKAQQAGDEQAIRRAVARILTT